MRDELSRFQKVFLLVGSLGPLGHLPASGTITVAVAGIPLFWLMRDISYPIRIVIALAFALVSVFVHQYGDQVLSAKDSRTLVWDEIAGYLVATMLLPFSWTFAIAAFVIERVLDIAKAPPANWVEKHWPGGWGVVGDDVVAGLYTCALIWIVRS
jgi:phosphatidylglycerophosphatase A